MNLSFSRWQDLLAAETKTLNAGDLVDRWQIGVEIERLARDPAFLFVIESVRNHYLSAIAGEEGKTTDALISIRAGLRNIDVITDTVAVIKFQADAAKQLIEQQEQEEEERRHAS